jgi:hypothetical protein
VPALQEQSPEFKPQPHQNKKDPIPDQSKVNLKSNQQAHSACHAMLVTLK